jgi:hypothetical protein
MVSPDVPGTTHVRVAGNTTGIVTRECRRVSLAGSFLFLEESRAGKASPPTSSPCLRVKFKCISDGWPKGAGGEREQIDDLLRQLLRGGSPKLIPYVRRYGTVYSLKPPMKLRRDPDFDENALEVNLHLARSSDGAYGQHR